MCMDNQNKNNNISVGKKANYDELFPKEEAPRNSSTELSINPDYMSDRVDLSGVRDPDVIKRILMEDQIKNRDMIRYSNLNKYINNALEYKNRIDNGTPPNNVLYLKERADKSLKNISKSFE